MAKKRHGGLGRGLDALIPQARRVEPENNASGVSTIAPPDTAPQTSRIRASPPPKDDASFAAVSRSKPVKSSKESKTACEQLKPCLNKANAF